MYCKAEVMAKRKLEPEILEGAPLRYAPTNELGVDFLFSNLCRRMQLHVESIQAGFPDCIVRQRVGGKEVRIRVEFKFRSINFRAHGHAAEECDWIVCWEHDWPGVPQHLKVVELRRYFARGFNVWLMIGQPEEGSWPARGKMAFGNRVAKGDLLLFYEAHPSQSVRHLYAVADEGEVETYKSDGKRGTGTFYGHTVRRVCTLKPPLPLKAIESDPLLSRAGLFSGKHNRKITEHWWRVYELIARKYPMSAAALEPISPSKI